MTDKKMQQDLLRRYEQAVGTLVHRMLAEAERRAEMMIVGEPVAALDLKIEPKAKPKAKPKGERSERTHLVGAKGATRCGHMKLNDARTAGSKAFPTSAHPCGTCARVAGIKLK